MSKKHSTPLLGLVGALFFFAVVWYFSSGSSNKAASVVGLSISASSLFDASKTKLDRSQCLGMMARLDNAYTTLQRIKAFRGPGPFLPPLSTITLSDSLHADCQSAAEKLAWVQTQIAEWQKTANTPAYLDTQGHHKAVSVPGFSDAQRSFAQSGQDTEMWKQHLSKIGKTGTFIEMGAFNGVGFSNSLMLEDIGWRGVCIEGHPLLYKYVQRNRPLCLNVNAVVTAQAGEVEYVYTNELSGPMAGSGIVEFMSPQKLKDFELHAANGGATVLREKIETRTLDDIVGTFGMQHVDLFSLDTEGSELSVLQSIDFTKVSFGFLLIEQSNVKNEKAVRKLLEAHNYEYLNVLVDQDHLFKYRGRAT